MVELPEDFWVPNAPCGVESQKLLSILLVYLFLMHRVELKAGLHEDFLVCVAWFLMHRVELKDYCCKLWTIHGFGVPNAPCGVES